MKSDLYMSLLSSLHALAVDYRHLARAVQGQIPSNKIKTEGGLPDSEATFRRILVQAQLVSPQLVAMLGAVATDERKADETDATYYNRVATLYQDTYLKIAAEARKDLHLVS